MKQAVTTPDFLQFLHQMHNRSQMMSLLANRWDKVWEPQTGDVHFYTVTDNPLVITTFPRARFISEFGFQSFASFKSYKAMSDPSDWNYLSKATQFRCLSLLMKILSVCISLFLILSCLASHVGNQVCAFSP